MNIKDLKETIEKFDDKASVYYESMGGALHELSVYLDDEGFIIFSCKYMETRKQEEK